MRTYLCVCGQPVFFNNSVCIACGRAIGFDPASREMRALDLAEEGVHQQALAEVAPKRGFFRRAPRQVTPQRYRFCANLNACGCNWLIPADSDPASLCPACGTTRVIPDLSQPGNGERWTKLETAKRRLLFTLLDHGLWGPGSVLEPAMPMVFDFLQSLPGQPSVLTGHDTGVITLNVQEADDDLREKTRLEMREPYRSLLGHFRHESGHYYWDVLIAGSPWLEEFRSLFGDETADYAMALQRNYTEGPPPGWEEKHISAYAASHPWEDWAETWAHWLHMSDTLETADSAECRSNFVQPKIDPALLCEEGQEPTPEVQAFCERVSHWVALTTLVNELTRSMGQPDAYPFVCSGLVLKKLFFIDRVMHPSMGE
ncbi:MAG: putative zinc-binding metallopeptidase [Verrucomicrobiota bacterium]